MMHKPRPSYLCAIRLILILMQPKCFSSFSTCTLSVCDDLCREDRYFNCAGNYYADLSQERAKKKIIERHYTPPRPSPKQMTVPQSSPEGFDCRILGFHLLASAGIILRA
jgi:hypothetical protein